jgi:Catalytic LigB subunit of aromatic ring-opening dioxygenase
MKSGGGWGGIQKGNRTRANARSLTVTGFLGTPLGTPDQIGHRQSARSEEQGPLCLPQIIAPGPITCRDFEFRHAMDRNSSVMLGCSSHSPLIVINPVDTPDSPAIDAEIADFRKQVEAFDPDYIVMFANDHFANFHYSNMPAYCVGVAAEAMADIGGTPGKIPSVSTEAVALVDYLRKAGFDPAISYKMMMDHGFSQPIARLVGAIDRYPLIPIFISVFT